MSEGKDNGLEMASNKPQNENDLYSEEIRYSTNMNSNHFSNSTSDTLSAIDENDLNNVEVYCSEHHVDEDFLTWRQVIFALLPLAAPSVMSIALTFGAAVIPLAFIGSMLGNEALSGASVAYFIISIVAQYPLCGLTFAMDALCSQEYGRDPESNEQGVILQRGVIIGIVFMLPVNIILLLLQQLLPVIYGQKIGEIAGDFMKFGILFIIPLVTFTAFSKFCLNQFKPQLPMTALVVGVIITPLLQYFLIKQGIHGSMIGMAIVSWVQLFVIISLILWVESTRRTLGKLRIKEALDWDGLSEYLHLALPSSIFVAAEASAFDVALLLSASLGTSEGAAFSAILNTLLMFVSLSGGMSMAACAKIGSSLGAQLPKCAWKYVIVAVSFVFAISSFNGIIIFIFYDNILSLFGVEKDSLKVAHSVRWIIPITHIADSMQYVFQGVFSGMGHNKKGAQILISCLWIIGFPLELVLTYGFGCDLAGIIGGLTIGLLIESPAMFWYVSKVDWEELAKEVGGSIPELPSEDDRVVTDIDDN